VLRSLWLLFLYVSFIGLGIAAPFVLTLGYVWVDTFQPQLVAYIILNQLPVAMIMGAAAFVGYFALDRRAPPRPTLIHLLHVVMAIWVTVTLIWAEAPDSAWDKWDWAFKTLAFSAFVPLVIRSRLQIEAFAQTYVFSLAANFVPFGLKTLISGGGYGTNLGLTQGNYGLAEGGQLSTVCLMAVPIALFLSRHSQLLPKFKLMPLGYYAIAGLAIVTALGTYERSALIGLVVLGAYMLTQSRRKVLFGCLVAIIGVTIVYTASSRWEARIKTIGHFEQENSAYTRILVWKWTLGYIEDHPLGGGFNAYLIDHIDFPPDPEHPGGFTEFGRAFHSIYFEILGEQGIPGIILFLSLVGTMMLSLRRLTKRTRKTPELAWCADLSGALQSGVAVFLTSGAFVSIAFQPIFWYFVAMSISLRAYVWRVEQQAKPLEGWRHTAQGAVAHGAWRNKGASQAVNARLR